MKVTVVRGRAIDPAVNKIAKALFRNGHGVKLLVWDRRNTLKSAQGDGYTLHRFNLKAPYDSLWVVFFLPLWWLCEFFFLLRNRADVVHACDLDTLLPAILAKLVRRNKLFYHIYDFYANNLPDGRPRLIRRLIRSLVASAEKFGIRFAEVLFLADESRYEEVRGARINRLVYIYNSPPDYFDAKEKRESGDGTEIDILYVGVLVKPRGLEYMIKAVADLEGVRLIIGGTGLEKEFIEESARRCAKIQYIGWIPSYEGVIKKTLEADVVFRFSDPAHPKTKYESPCKLFEAMMCQKPIIVSDSAAMTNIVRKEHCGLVVPYGDVAAIKEAVLKLKNDPELRRTLGRNGRKAYEERYNWEIMKNRLIEAYHELTKSG